MVLGWQTTVAGCGVIIGNLIKYCIVLYHPNNAAIGSQWFPTLLAIIALITGGIFNLYCKSSECEPNAAEGESASCSWHKGRSESER